MLHQSFKNILEKLVFIVIFRPFASSIIILAFVISGIINPSLHFPGNLIYIFLAFILFLTVLYTLILKYLSKKGKPYQLSYFGFIQLFLDLIFIFAIVLLTGGLNSKLIFLFYLLILMGGFLFLNLGALIFSVVSAMSIGAIANLQYYFNFKGHQFFISNPDSLLLLTSLNILGVLIFGSFLYHYSNGVKLLTEKIIEKDDFIRNSQNFTRELVDSFSQGTIVLDKNFAIIFINRAAIAIFDIENTLKGFNGKSGILNNFNIYINDIINNFPMEIFKENSGLNDISSSVEVSVSGKSRKNPVERFELKYGDKIIGFSINTLPDNRNMPGKYILLFRDISFIKELEMESKINEALATAGKLAGWMAHELKNPLLAINTSVYLLQTKFGDGCHEPLSEAESSADKSKYKKIIGIIRNETLRLNAIAGDFLRFLRVESGSGLEEASGKVAGSNEKLFADDEENFNLFNMVEELRSGMDSVMQSRSGERVKINLHNRINPNIMVSCKKTRIRQVLDNLSQNSVQAVLAKGESGKRVNSGIVRFGAVFCDKSDTVLPDGGKFLRITVADNGCGMDDFVLKNAFKPLFTTRESGFGLGLSLVKSIIEDCGGEISVKSGKGKGTLIKIILPVN